VQKEYMLALRDADQVVDISPKLASGYLARAKIYEAAAKDEKIHQKYGIQAGLQAALNAIDDYETSLELKPELQESIDGLKRMGVAR
jgi:hypothetical protein